MDEIYENMCRGLAAHSSSSDPSTAILTLEKSTGNTLRRFKARNRRLSLCTGSGRLRCPPGFSCDEFPFASSVEGGSGAQIMCVPRWQNDWQGSYYGSWLSEQLNSGKLIRGGQYRVTIKGLDCSKYLRKRLNARNDGLLSDQGNGMLFWSV